MRKDISILLVHQIFQRQITYRCTTGNFQGQGSNPWKMAQYNFFRFINGQESAEQDQNRAPIKFNSNSTTYNIQHNNNI